MSSSLSGFERINSLFILAQSVQVKSGGNSEEVTPVPIPNTAVKLFSADGNKGLPLVRAGRCQANERHPCEEGVFFYTEGIIGRKEKRKI